MKRSDYKFALRITAEELIAIKLLAESGPKERSDREGLITATTDDEAGVVTLLCCEISVRSLATPLSFLANVPPMMTMAMETATKQLFQTRFGGTLVAIQH